MKFEAQAFTKASYRPMEVVNIDTIGPLPPDEEGNSFILVIVDCFTRWVELYPLKDTTAALAARKILEFAGRFGFPTKFRSDQGSQFVNAIIQELLSILGSDHELSMAYSKEENGIVERMNREVNRHLRNMLWDNRVRDNWSFNCLPLIMRILNSEVKTATGCSPAQLLFGNAVELKAKVFRDIPKTEKVNYDYFRYLIKMQNALLEIAAETQRETDEYHLVKRNNDNAQDSTSVEKLENSLVLWDDPARSVPKLKYTWQGPFLVIKKEGDAVTLQCLINGKTWVTHIRRIRPYLYDSKLGFPEPKAIAAKDLEEFFIEKIVDHRLIEGYTNPSMANGYMFLVAWSGYPNQDSWEPYKNLRQTTQLHDYILQTPALKPIQAYVKKYIAKLEKEV
jgi:hypothetical protein